MSARLEVRLIAALTIVGLLASGCAAAPASTTAEAPASSAAATEPSATEPSATEPSVTESPAADAPVPFDVTVMGGNIHGSCVGTRPTGAPAAILVHGIGGDYTDLSVIEEHLTGHTMVCGYSRAGVGQSDEPAESPRPAADLITEMHDVLGAANVPPPYFLVGFSGGGSLAMMYAQAHSDDVVGFVSINPSPPYVPWIDISRDIWTPEEHETIEVSWYAGENHEGIDMTGTGSMLTDPLPATLPYAVMFDEDCGGDTAVCDRLLEPLAETTEQMAGVGEGGRFVWVRGAGHDIDLTQPERVREVLDEIWSEATD